MSARINKVKPFVALLLAGWVGCANASILTFEHLIIDRLDLAGVQTEGDFSYLAVGFGWEVIDFPGTRPPMGNPPSALSTFRSGPISESPIEGDYVDIFLTRGGFFTFNSVDFRTVLAWEFGNSDDVTIFGLLNGVAVDSLDLFDSSMQFLTVDSGFTNPIDTLRVQIALHGHSDALVLDNFNLTPSGVPLPGGVPLLIFGLAVLGYSRRGCRLIE